MKWNVIRVMMGVVVAVVFGMAGCGGGGSSNNAPNNKTTAANAGPAQNVVAGSLVTLNGSQSTGADGSLITYQWSMTTKPAGSSAALSSAAVAKPTFTADVAGAYVLNLVVNDGKVNSAAVTVTITAAVANAAPVANAGAAQSVVTGAVVTLDGSASRDANGDPLTYRWSFTSKPDGSNATLSSFTAVNPSFTPDVAGAYVFNLVVNDRIVNSVAATVTVTSEQKSKWEGKKIVWFGTSISDIGDPVQDVTKDAYPNLTARILQASIDNQSVSGSQVAWMGAYGGTNLSATIAELIGNGNDPAYSYENKMIGKNADLYVFDHGHNDYMVGNCALGVLAESGWDKNTFLGAMEYLLDKLYADNPSARIVLVTPPNKWSGQTSGIYTVQTLTRAEELRTAIIALGAKYKLPVCDLMNTAGFNVYNYTLLMGDDAHPTDDIHPWKLSTRMKLANILSNFIKENL